MTISIQKIIQKSLQIDNNQHKDNPFDKTNKDKCKEIQN